MRKLQEAELALWLERKYSKNEILELYLNRVYFGSGAYGVEAAASAYSASRRGTSRWALAGLVKMLGALRRPSNPEGAEARAKTVLAAMAEERSLPKRRRRRPAPLIPPYR